MEDHKEVYYNFPIQLLNGFLTDKSECLDNILCYATYVRSQKLMYNTARAQFNAAINYMGWKSANPDCDRKKGKELFESLPEKSPMVGISHTVFWQYYSESRTKWQDVELLGYLALKSIVGQKEYAKTTNNLWFSRMNGNVSIGGIDTELYQFKTEYKSRKLRQLLEMDWNVSMYCQHTNGFYFSFKRDKEFIIRIAEQRKKNYKQREMKEKEQRLIAKVKAELNISDLDTNHDHK